MSPLISKIKDCRTVLSELGFRETRLNYWCLGTLHVEIRDINGNERWEIVDYEWKKGEIGLTRKYGEGSYDLKFNLVKQ